MNLYVKGYEKLRTLERELLATAIYIVFCKNKRKIKKFLAMFSFLIKRQNLGHLLLPFRIYSRIL